MLHMGQARTPPARQPPGVAGVLRASGLSRRFGRANKLLLPLHGVPLVRRTARAFVDAGLDPIVVVVGHQADEVAHAVSGVGADIVLNPDFKQGQSRALVRGVGAVEDAAAAVIGVADQPFLSAAVVRSLLQAYRETGSSLVVPRYAGRRGNPVLFDRVHFPELLRVEGDTGGKQVIERHREEIAWVDVVDARAGMDLDTAEEYRVLARSDE